MSRFSIAGTHEAVTVKRALLGAGGQGEVFHATYGGQPFALKLYYVQTATPEQRKAVERLIPGGAPAHYFLWPMHIVEDSQEARFGYLMPLREPRFKSTEDLVARRVNASIVALLTAAQQVADAFFRLHARGLCYQDISFGNVFLDPATGDIRICDNDNVTINNSGVGGVYGTPRFMAPEVVRVDAKPSDETDRFSLAVLLFYLLFNGHPLEGKRESSIRCLDLPAMNRLYGTDPLYIFDPKDASNRPDPAVHGNPIAFRQIYPKVLLDSFERAFTAGLAPGHRIRESEWRKILARARDLVMKCENCSAENFHDEAATAAQHCWHCKRGLTQPMLLSLEGDLVVLQADRELHPHHIRREAFNYREVLARVTRNPADPRRLGLQNLSTECWSFTRPDGTTAEVAHGKNVPIVVGNRIHFGMATADVVAAK